MKKIILSLILAVLAVSGYAQMNTFGGIGLRVKDTVAYQTNAATYHTQGYSDIYYNWQATNRHFDIWNGSSYTHVFDFNSGTGGSFTLTDGELTTANGTAVDLGGTASANVDLNLNTHELYIHGGSYNTIEGTNEQVLKNTASDAQVLISPVNGIQVDGGTQGAALKGATITIEDNGDTGGALDFLKSDGSGSAIWDVINADDLATLTASRTFTTSDDLDQTDNLRIVYTDCAAPCNVTVDLLSTGTQVTVINNGASTATLIEDPGNTTLTGTTIPIASGENALIIYKVAATPDVYVSSASSGGTVTSVTSANADITVATGTTTPVLTMVQTPALRSATTTVNVSSATAPTSGQVLTATGASAATWQTPSSGFSDPMTTRGDIIVRNASNVTARLGIGASGRLLQSDGTDISWAAPTFWSLATGGTTTGTNTLTLGTNPLIYSSGVTTGTGATAGIQEVYNSLTTGNGLDISSSSLSSGSLVNLSSTSTAAASNTQKVLNVALSGANATTTQTTTAGKFSNTHTGTSSTNYGIWAIASGGTTNYAGLFQSNILVQNTGAGSAVITERTDGKALALIAGSSGAIYSFDDTGIFSIVAGTRSAIMAGTGTGTTLITATSTGLTIPASIPLFMGNGTVTASTKLDVRGIGTTTDIIQRWTDSGDILRMSILSNGQLNITKTMTAAGTTGAQTIDRVQGSVNFAAAATTLVVTNALVTTSSNVFVQVYGTDVTATSARVTLAAGSFTITLNAAATAETKVGFFVLN